MIRRITVGLVTTAVILGVLAYLGVVGGLYALQDAMIFPGAQHGPALADTKLPPGFRRIHVQTEDGLTLAGWYRPGDKQRGLIFFPGNDGRLGFTRYLAQQLPNVDIVAITYRGYAGNPGTPSETGLQLDADAVWRFLTEQVGIPPEKVVVEGHSLGGGVTQLLVSQHRPACMVLHSTFLSIERLATESYPFLPVSLLLRHRFRVEELSPSLDVPTLLTHGTADSIIPVAHGRKLRTLLPRAQYVEGPGRGHNDLLITEPAGNRTWHSFLQRCWGSSARSE